MLAQQNLTLLIKDDRPDRHLEICGRMMAEAMRCIQKGRMRQILRRNFFMLVSA